MLAVSLLAGILICFGVPVIGLALLRGKKKGAGKAFLLGGIAFVVSQLLVRLPILQGILPYQTWFVILQMDPWAYGLFLGATAGLAEETARWIAIRFFLKKERDMEHGLAFGLGHGGVEAMIITGVNLAAGLVMVIEGKGALFPADGGTVLVAGMERLYAMAFHVGASLLVMHGVRRKKALIWVVCAIALHTIMDAAIVILPAVFGVGMLGVELYGAAAGVLTLVLGSFVFLRGRRLLEKNGSAA